MDIGQPPDTKLTRIGVFYDGGFFSHVSNYYRYYHERKTRISIQGLHGFIRDEVGKHEQTDARYCQIVEAHYFRGRFPTEDVQELYRERQFEDALMRAGVTTHFLPALSRGEDDRKEKGIDVCLALEAFERAIYKGFNVIVLVTGDSDFVPLIRKLNALGIRVMVTAWDFELPDGRSTRTAQSLIDEVTYPVMMDAVINDRARRNDPLIKNLFVPRSSPSPIPAPAPVELAGAGSRQSGSVNNIPEGKLYGFIKPDSSGENLFFHQTGVEGCDFNELRPGDRVEFTSDVNPRDGRPVARKVARLSA